LIHDELKRDKFAEKFIMSTIEIKHIIAEYLSLIDDVSFLKALKTIVESKVSEGTYQLSDYQKRRIQAARDQMKAGKTISNRSLKKEIDQWLNSK